MHPGGPASRRRRAERRHADGRPRWACPARTATPAAANLMPPTLPRSRRAGRTTAAARGNRSDRHAARARRPGAAASTVTATPVEKRGTAVSRTARRPAPRARPDRSGALAAASLVLSGCAAGQYSQTADQVAAIDGANGTVGDIAVLNARLAPTEREKYPAGSDARLLLWISNDGLTADTLSSVSTSAAELGGDHRRSGRSRPDAAPTSPPSRAPRSPSPASLQDLYYGQSIPMTFNFANAGSAVAEHPDPGSGPSAPPTGRRSTSCRRTRRRSGKRAQAKRRGRRRARPATRDGAAETTSESGTDRRLAG